MRITIRSAIPADLAAIKPLQEQIARLHYEGRPDLFRNEIRRLPEDEFMQRLSDPTHTILMAEDAQGQIVGYAFAWVISHRDHPTYQDFDTFYIDDICVLDTCRRQGVGKLLFDRCREKADALGCRNLELGVWTFNESAIAFYESCGMKTRTLRMELKLC